MKYINNDFADKEWIRKPGYCRKKDWNIYLVSSLITAVSLSALAILINFFNH